MDRRNYKVTYRLLDPAWLMKRHAVIMSVSSRTMFAMVSQTVEIDRMKTTVQLFGNASLMNSSEFYEYEPTGNDYYTFYLFICQKFELQDYSNSKMNKLLTTTFSEPLDQGAYTCEAINVKGRVLATPDCIVRIVNIPAPNPPPRIPVQQPSCDIRGAASHYPDHTGACPCKRDIDQNANFEFTKTGFLTYSQRPQGTKYWRLPQRFLGDKVTAYGGKMEFEVEYSGTGSLNIDPIVVLKGNQMILVHKVRNQDQILHPNSPIRITVETYETNYEQLNGAPATREDLLMVLADLDAFLIRATHVDSQYSSSMLSCPF
uniref:Laminin IV type A domain-containing protein n=1 Tax=Heterorhabditis bacteriophora TaxID=37862 RepID=A0A1I7WE19_HETBA